MKVSSQKILCGSRPGKRGVLAATMLALVTLAAEAGVVRVINVDFNFAGGPPGPTYSGKGAVVDQYGTYWNGVNTGSATGLLDSKGNPSLVSWSGFGADGGFNDGSANALHSDRLYNNINGDANWSFGGFQVGSPVDLYFYGHINTTFTVSDGIEEGVVSTSITSGALMTLAAPDHSDWIEGTHFAHIRVTPTQNFVSGTYTQAGAQSAFSGVQIVGVTAIPEPSALGLLGVGAALLQAARRRKTRA